MRPIILSAILGIACFASPIDAGPIQTIYLSAEDEGWQPGATVNDRGEVAFIDQGKVYFGNKEALKIVTSTSDPLPGVEAGTICVGMRPYLDNAGHVHVIAGLAHNQGTMNRYAFFEYANELLSPDAVPGGIAPGVGNGVFFANDEVLIEHWPVYSRTGTTSLKAKLAGSGVHRANNVGIWSNANGQLSLVVREGDRAPGVQPGWVFHDISKDTAISTSAHGLVAFGAAIGPANADRDHERSIWLANQGVLQLIVRSSDALPGLDDMYPHYFREPKVNDAGELVFAARESTTTIFHFANGVIVPLLSSGATFAEAPDFRLNLDYRLGYEVSQSGTIAVTGELWKPNPNPGPSSSPSHLSALLSNASGDFRVVAHEAMHPPGLPEGAKFRDGFTYSYNWALNGNGRIAFHSDYTDENGAYQMGIWAEDSGGNLQLIIHTGDSFEVARGDLRIIEDISEPLGTFGIDENRAWFNDVGQVVVAARFTDGSKGVFISNAVAIPEPASALLLCIATAGLVLFVRRIQMVA